MVQRRFRASLITLVLFACFTLPLQAKAPSACLSRLFAAGITKTIGLGKEGPVTDLLALWASKTETAKYLEEGYREAQRRAAEGENFVSALARALRVAVIDPAYEAKIPKEGSLLFIGNHPFGLADGIAAYEFLDRARPGEVMGMATTALREFMPEFAPHMAFIDNGVYPDTPKFKDKRDAQARNNALQSLKALRWLQEGKVLCFFPAGLTSRRVSIRDAHAVDRDWKRGVGFFSRVTDSPLVMMHVEGSNTRISDLFSWLGEDIPLLARPWETRNRADSGFNVTISDPLYPQSIPEDLPDSLRTTYILNEYLAFARGEASWQR